MPNVRWEIEMNRTGIWIAWVDCVCVRMSEWVSEWLEMFGKVQIGQSVSDECNLIMANWDTFQIALTRSYSIVVMVNELVSECEYRCIHKLWSDDLVKPKKGKSSKQASIESKIAINRHKKTYLNGSMKTWEEVNRSFIDAYTGGVGSGHLTYKSFGVSVLQGKW